MTKEQYLNQIRTYLWMAEITRNKQYLITLRAMLATHFPKQYYSYYRPKLKLVS